MNAATVMVANAARLLVTEASDVTITGIDMLG